MCPLEDSPCWGPLAVVSSMGSHGGGPVEVVPWMDYFTWRGKLQGVPSIRFPGGVACSGPLEWVTCRGHLEGSTEMGPLEEFRGGIFW